MSDIVKSDVNIKTFNTAKVFTEQILFPMMADYKKFLRLSNFGSINLEDSAFLTEEYRDIERYNGLKAMAETCYDLAEAIESTVRLKKNKDELNKLLEIKAYLKEIRKMFYNERDKFFKLSEKNPSVETINRVHFDKIKELIQAFYINVEMLMTRNKLLFNDQGDEFKDDKEIMDDIMREYTEG